MIRALLLGVYTRAPGFSKLPCEHMSQGFHHGLVSVSLSRGGNDMDVNVLLSTLTIARGV